MLPFKAEKKNHFRIARPNNPIYDFNNLLLSVRLGCTYKLIYFLFFSTICGFQVSHLLILFNFFLFFLLFVDLT